MFENFTEKAIKVIMLSNEESHRLGHNFVCTEQLLIGLIGEETGIAAKVLKSMGVTLKDARIEVEKIIGRGSGFLSVEIPFTPGAKRIIELSQEESHQLGHNYIGTEHLLLGSLLVYEGNASRVLANLGVDPTKIRPQVLRMLGETTEVRIRSKSSTALPRETDITILLESIETKTIAIDRAVNGLKKDSEYYEYSYCSIDKEDYYITIDNYLGKYQLVKLIDPLAEIVRVKFPIAVVDSSVAVTDDKKEWILEYGSDLLQQSFMGGYDCNDRYLQEKIAYDYPGFEINEQNYPKVDSPNQICFDACLGYEDAYCSSNNNSYYITLDNFLGKYQLIKSIDGLVKVTEQNSASGLVINDLLGIKIKKDKTLTNSNFVVLAASLSTFLVGLFTILYVIYVIRSSI
jgi:Clp amino terminal domain, pathogenicity island component